MTLWIAFLIGQILNVFRRAALVSSSPKNIQINSVWMFFVRNDVAFAIRGVLGAGLYALLMAGPWTVKTWTIPQLPKHWAVALMFGIVFDVVFESAQTKWPFLKLQFPTINGSQESNK